LPANESYSAYVFIPEKYKKVDKMIIKDASFSGNDGLFDIKFSVDQEE
jgi:hypothetical protein